MRVVPQFRNWVTWPRPRPLRGQFMFRTHEGSALDLCTKFEVDSVIRSKVVRGVPKFRNWVTWPRPRPLRGQFFTHEVNYAVRLSCQNLVSIRYSPPEILRFYNFATLAGKCLTTPPFWGFLGVLNPLILWVITQTPKRHILGWRRVI